MNKKEIVPGLISVILPVYNSSEYIIGAVGSILNQTYSNFELIIIDDGSSDNTAELINKIKDPRIVFYKREKEGLVNQLNFGLSLAKGEYIARMDADDLCEPNKFETQINFMQKNRNIRLTGTNYYYINPKGKIIVEKKFPEYHKEIEFMMPVITSVLHSSILVYKEELEKIKGYNKAKLYAEDHDLFLRLIENGCIMYNIQRPLYYYRTGNATEASINVKIQQSTVYLSGLNYLNKKYSLAEKDSFEYLYRIALLEYYRGDINKARKIFLRLVISKPSRLLSISRYALLSMFGNKVVSLLRKRNILPKTSYLINRCFHKDLNSINIPPNN